ncbi:MAG: ATP-binding protein, partial [Treponema sp.]|nr:ATP-binding protein [Treponema sp.]
DGRMGGMAMGMHGMGMHGMGMRGRMPRAPEAPDGRYRRLEFPIEYDGIPVGRVLVETSAPFFLDESQAAFAGSLRALILVAGIVLAALSAAIAAILSGALSRPILQASGAALKIAGGDWSARVPEGQRTRELGELSRSINHLARALDEGDRRQKRLTSDVAHELRTPLAALQGNVEAMMDGLWEPSPERLASCHEEIRRLSSLVGDLGRLSMIEREGPELSLARLDLGALLADVAGQFERSARAKGVSLEPDLCEAPIIADSDKLRQVFVNLLSNAVKYTDRGRITVALRREGARYVATVGDTGAGISPEDMPHVFERFFRADRSRSRATGGAGIGLAIAAAIAEAHGGRIEARSELGRGSEFAVFLPAP